MVGAVEGESNYLFGVLGGVVECLEDGVWEEVDAGTRIEAGCDDYGCDVVDG